jgi:hypothetical protein
VNTQDNTKDKPGVYVMSPIRPLPPVIAFGESTAPLSSDACPTCRNLDIDCVCESERAS